MKVLVTGAAGFIGYHLCEALIQRGDEVIGLDNLNAYYDPALKISRLKQLGIENTGMDNCTSILYPTFSFFKMDLDEKDRLFSIFNENKFNAVINLAAQVGVRYSLTKPDAYIHSNIVGFLNILEACRHYPVEHLVYASSSSVYGCNTEMPFSVHQSTNHPMSLYAATKKSNELMAHTYSHLFNIPTTGLRFFTVYGPWGRPDMALFTFTKAIVNGEPIKVFNSGNMKRDFTYVADIVQGILGVINNKATSNSQWNGDTPDPATSKAPYRIYNIGNNKPANLMEFIEAIENELGKKAIKEYLPIQPGDVPSTNADINDLIADTGYCPKYSVQEGVSNFIQWYKKYYLS